ncbi:hypothetical protein [Undibacterium sp. Xuan67W]|uniref:hypothetical protein n=1 Tax=Undibacterium sp. Xuan67W TaxID=3413057 RepID=UPI003BF473B6
MTMFNNCNIIKKLLALKAAFFIINFLEFYMQALNMLEVDQVSGAVSSDATLGAAVAFCIYAATLSNPVGVAVFVGASLAMSVATAIKDMN